jgi:hypothetical protein
MALAISVSTTGMALSLTVILKNSDTYGSSAKNINCSLAILIPGINLAITVSGYANVNFYRPAAHLAIFDILLRFHRSVNQDGYQLATIRAANGVFFKEIHIRVKTGSE